jgi:hypothetical protein
MKNIKKIFSRKNFLITSVFFLLIIAIVAVFYFYNNLQAGKITDAEAEVLSLQASVGKLIELPDETPTIATVSDKSKLLDQPFFAKAENGDKVLIFTQGKKAIIYRPTTGKIIEVAPINLSENLGNPIVSPQATPSIEETINISVYNGTKIRGLARAQADKLESNYPNVEVISTANSANDYTETLVIDLSGQNSEFVKMLVEDLGGKFGVLPQGEIRPANADILVIVGE